MSDFSVLQHPYFYLLFISLHLFFGQFGSSMLYRLRYGKSPLICYETKQPNRHQQMSQWLAVPVIVWFVLMALFLTSAPFRALSINQPIIIMSPFWGLFLAAICLLGMLYCQFAMGRAFRIGQESETSQQQSTLVDYGIFRYSRNPVYVFSTLFLWVVSSWACTIPVLLSLMLISGLIHQLVLLEEQFLHKRFGTSYVHYQKRVPRYVFF